MMPNRSCFLILSAWVLVAAGNQLLWTAAAAGQPPPASVFDGGGPPAPAGDGTAGLGPSQQAEVVALRTGFTQPDANGTAELFIAATIQSGWHIYSITQAPGGPVATKIKLDASDAYRLLGDFQTQPPPNKKKEPVFDNLLVETHKGRVKWFAAIRLAAGVDPARVKISGRLTVQPCQADQCLPPHDLPFVAALSRDAARTVPAISPVPAPPALPPVPPALAPPPETAGPPQPVLPPEPPGPAAARHRLPWQPFTTTTAFAKLLGPELDLEKVRANVHQQATGQSSLGLWAAIGFGFLGGLILNIMPCVLPVIGLKILSFIEQAGHDRRRGFTLNVWYSLGLLSVFLVLATLAVSPQHLGWGELFTHVVVQHHAGRRGVCHGA